jgi:Cu2+-exporting ATPase
MAPAQLLAKAASLACSSNHPSAQAIARAAAAQPAHPGSSWRDIREVPGSGIEAVDEDGLRFRLGAGAWAGGVPEPASAAAAQSWLACEGTPLASFGFSESERPDAAAAVRALRSTGLDILVLSGDAESRVRLIADRLGITDARGGLQPEDKLAVLAGLQRTGQRVGMAGDGLNDAPVMARADVSFAMAGGSAVTRAQADFLVLSGRLGDIAFAREIARRTMRVVRQSFGWALTYNAVSVPLALAGWFPPWAAAIGMGASSLVVVLNALRIDRQAPACEAPRAGAEHRRAAVVQRPA